MRIIVAPVENMIKKREIKNNERKIDPCAEVEKPSVRVQTYDNAVIHGNKGNT